MVLEIAERETARKAIRRWRVAEGNGDNLGIFHCATHDDEANEMLGMPVICRDKSRTRNRWQVYRKKVVLNCDRRTTDATTMRAKRHAPPDPLVRPK